MMRKVAKGAAPRTGILSLSRCCASVVIEERSRAAQCRMSSRLVRGSAVNIVALTARAISLSKRASPCVEGSGSGPAGAGRGVVFSRREHLSMLQKSPATRSNYLSQPKKHLIETSQVIIPISLTYNTHIELHPNLKTKLVLSQQSYPVIREENPYCAVRPFPFFLKRRDTPMLRRQVNAKYSYSFCSPSVPAPCVNSSARGSVIMMMVMMILHMCVIRRRPCVRRRAQCLYHSSNHGVCTTGLRYRIFLISLYWRPAHVAAVARLVRKLSPDREDLILHPRDSQLVLVLHAAKALLQATDISP